MLHFHKIIYSSVVFCSTSELQIFLILTFAIARLHDSTERLLLLPSSVILQSGS